MSLNPFGPQGANVALTLPAASPALYGLIPTFVKNATSCGSNDGTVLDATFFNNIINNLNYLVTTSGISPALRGDPTVIYRAVQASSDVSVDNGVI